jgi:hypothetical protein
MKKQYGDFGDAGLDDPVTSEPLAKSKDDSIDWKRLIRAIEILENWSPERLSKAQLYRIQQKAGLAHAHLQKAIFNYVSRPRKEAMNKAERGNAMEDAGLGEDKKPVIPEVGTKEKFVKAKKELDAFGDELKK